MEVISGTHHCMVPVDHPTRVGEARRIAAEQSRSAGLDDVQAGRVALVVTELGANLQRHASKGVLLLGTRRGEVEVVAFDRGPGIANLPQSLADGYSTGGTPGTGLGAVRRLADDFDIYSTAPEGTVVVARVRSADAAARSAFRVAGLSIAAPGETVCGDGWSVVLQGSTAHVVVADGLGHGPDAAVAAAEAINTFEAEPALAPRLLLDRMHARLRSTRGAAVSIYRADAASDSVRSAAAGNVMARLVSGVSDKSILGQHGTVGVQMRSVQELDVPWPAHAVLVVHSDGIESRWQPQLLAPALAHDPAVAAALLLRDHCRGRDDATVVVVGRPR